MGHESGSSASGEDESVQVGGVVDGVVDEVVELGVEWEVVADGLAFPEGPVAMPDGSVVLVEIAAGRLTRVLHDGSTETVADLGGGPNGAAVGPDGALYLCNNGGYFRYEDADGLAIPYAGADGWERGSIQRVAPATEADADSSNSRRAASAGEVARREFATLYDSCDGDRLLAPNDIVFDDAGGFWFTDHGVHAHEDGPTVLYATADGSSIVGAVHGLDATNGVGLSPDGTVLYVAETYLGRLWAFDVEGPGRLRSTGATATPDDGRLLHDAGGSAMFDSLAVAADGSVCVATLLTGGITVVPPDGGPATFVPVGDPLTTNICFGGPDLRTAWVTSSGTGRLLRGTWPNPGLALRT